MTIFHNKRVEGERIIYTSSPFAKQNLIYLQEIGTSKYLEPYLSCRNGLSSYLFCIVLDGSGQLKYQNSSYSLSEGDCILVNCNMQYEISTKEDLWSLSWIHFNSPTMNSIYQKFLERCGAPCFKSSDSSVFIDIHRKIFEIANKDMYVRDMYIMSELSNLLTEVMRDCWHKAVDSDADIAERKWMSVREYIDQSFTENLGLDQIAEQFHINKFYLTRKFKEAYGQTINQYITIRRINKAKELLRFTDMNITEVAQSAGFNDAAYFSRVFKKLETDSPSDFRDKWNNNVVNTTR